MDIASHNNLGSYGVVERGVDALAHGNLAARLNAEIIGAPAIEARQNFGDINLLLDSKVILDTITLTTCIPGGTSPTGTPHIGDGSYTTVYTTEYVQVCPTETPCPKGTKTQTFTITETCAGNKQDYTPPALPPHFTTVVQVCDVCEGKPTLTVTCPESVATSVNGGTPQGGAANGGAASGGAANGGAANGGAANGGAANGGPANGGAAKGGAASGGAANEGAASGAGTNGNAVNGAGANGGAVNGAVASEAHPAASASGTGYVQAGTASSGRAELAAVLLGSVIGLTAWLL